MLTNSVLWVRYQPVRMNIAKPTKQPEATRRKLIDATTSLMLKQGFNATTVDDICAEAGVTKGAFFHHFKNKDEIAVAAIHAWSEMGMAMYAEAWKQPGQPLEEIHRIFNIMEEVTVKFDPCVCLVGMMSQEMSGEHPAFREATANGLKGWTHMMELRLESAKRQLKPAVDFDPAKVAWFLCSLWQGSMLVAKTQQSTELIRNNLKLAREFVDGLFANPRRTNSNPAQQEMQPTQQT
jgi:TetR/AcrR family transcriptional regulator, transcriptional repressor for nem operon